MDLGTVLKVGKVFGVKESLLGYQCHLEREKQRILIGKGINST